MNHQRHQISISIPGFLPKIGALRINFKQLILMMVLFLIIPLLAFYVFQVGMITGENYLIKNYTQELEKLASENGMLEVESAQNLSLRNIEKEIEKLNFVPVSKINYIPVSYPHLVRENR